MPRSKITSKSQDLITDDGSIIASIVHGEQTRINITASWLTNLSGYTITAKVVEGDNIQDSGVIPSTARETPVVTTLPILDTTPTDNIFDIVIPQDLINTWDTFPAPDKPIYGFIDLEIADTGTGNNQQIWKPMRGLIEVRYSPTEIS
jgi:hypothetical protein